MALVDIILIFYIFTFGNTLNVNFFPCDADANSTAVNCSHRPLTHFPLIQSATVLTLDLSFTKIYVVESSSFAAVPNLRVFELKSNCEPGRLRDAGNPTCRVDIHRDAFKNSQSITSLSLSGNSLTLIPLLPESLEFLDLQNNCIVNIISPFNTPNLHTLLLSRNCFYANPCNRSVFIDETVLKELPKLTNLTLGYNNLSSVPKGLPPSLKLLDLKENIITHISKRAFANLSALEFLSLEWNCQRCDHAARPCFPCPHDLPLQLDPEAFDSLNSSITFLSLRGNSLKEIPDGLFKPLKKLKALDLSDNLLSYAIRNGTFFNDLQGLSWLSLIYNYEPLKTFPELILSPQIANISSLERLLLSGNFFRRVSESSFRVLSQLQHLSTLELRMNFISACNLTQFNQLLSITTVDLSQNMLNFLPCCSESSDGSFAHKTCQNPNTLMDPFFESVHIALDRETTMETELCESGQSNKDKEDEICHIPPLWKFRSKFCKDKLTFDLSQNDILSLNQDMFASMKNVVCLDLSSNYMSLTLKKGPFNNMTKLEYLNVSFNRLDLYNRDAFGELRNSLKVLDISNNDFHFKMRGMGHRFEFLQNLTSLEVLSLANNGIGMRIDQKLNSRSLNYLYFSGNHLDLMWGSDNTNYNNFFQDLTNLNYLDISNNGLVSISAEVLHNLPKSIKVLQLSNNLLTYFPWNNLSTLVNLCNLNLSGNLLTYLTSEGIQFGPAFTLLDLSHNRITTIPENFFIRANNLKYLYLSHNRIKELNQQRLPVLFKNGSSLYRLTLHDNPFKCDCETSWFADFLRTTPIQIPHLTTLIHCEFPESLQGKSLLSIDQRSCQDIYGSLAFLVSTVLVVTLIVIPLLQHLYGWDVWYSLQVLWAGHKGYSQLHGRDSSYRYDAFVVFDTGNTAVRDWIYNELTVHLENSGQRRFCLCLEERDWIPGLSCIDNLYSAVNNSMKTVFVLARGENGSEMINGVMQQAFFMVQQRLLDEKVDTAVLVLLDEMFPKLKYLQLRKRLCRKSVLSWPRNPKAQPHFWNRMKMALSQDNVKLYDHNMKESFISNFK